MRSSTRSRTRAQKRPRSPPPPEMPDYVTIAAKIGATGAPLTACEPEARAIYRPDLGLAFGAVWSQAELRKVLRTIGARVLDLELPVRHAPDKFAGGDLVDEGVRAQIADVTA